MTEQECEHLKAEYDKDKTPYIDARLKDGTRVIARELRLVGGGCGGGGSSASYSESKK